MKRRSFRSRHCAPRDSCPALDDSWCLDSRSTRIDSKVQAYWLAAKSYLETKDFATAFGLASPDLTTAARLPEENKKIVAVDQRSWTLSSWRIFQTGGNARVYWKFPMSEEIDSDEDSEELDSSDFDAVVGYYNIGSLDRQQEIWDRAMPKELTDHMFAAFAHKAGSGPDSGSTPDLSPTSKKHCSSVKMKIRTFPTRRKTTWRRKTILSDQNFYGVAEGCGGIYFIGGPLDGATEE